MVSYPVQGPLVDFMLHHKKQKTKKKQTKKHPKLAVSSSTGPSQTLNPEIGMQKPPIARMGTKATVLCNDSKSSWASFSTLRFHPDLQDTSLGWKRGQFILQTQQTIQSTTYVLRLPRVPISGSCIGGDWDVDSWLLEAGPRQPYPSTWKQKIKKKDSNILFPFWVISFIYFHFLHHNLVLTFLHFSVYWHFIIRYSFQCNIVGYDNCFSIAWNIILSSQGTLII